MYSDGIEEVNGVEVKKCERIKFPKVEHVDGGESKTSLET
jgi:hypothetical protein